MRTPTAVKTSVSSAKLKMGIALPGAVSNETPSAFATAAMTVVAAAATRPPVAPIFHSDGRAGWVSVVTADSLAVTGRVIGALLGLEVCRCDVVGLLVGNRS